MYFGCVWGPIYLFFQSEKTTGFPFEQLVKVNKLLTYNYLSTEYCLVIRIGNLGKCKAHTTVRPGLGIIGKAN